MQISKTVAIGFAAALVASLVTIAYLIGRDHGRHRTDPIAVVSAPAPVAVPVPAAPVPTPAPIAERPAPSLAPTPSAPAPTYVPAPTAPAAGPIAPGEPGDGAAVQAYFMRMDALGGGALLGDNAQDVAERMLSSAVSGDTSGFDAMIKLAENAASAARTTSVPPSCAHFHSELLGVLDDSKTLIVNLKAAIKRSDTGALAAIGMGATSLQSRANALQQEEKSLKAHFGLK